MTRTKSLYAPPLSLSLPPLPFHQHSQQSVSSLPSLFPPTLWSSSSPFPGAANTRLSAAAGGAAAASSSTHIHSPQEQSIFQSRAHRLLSPAVQPSPLLHHHRTTRQTTLFFEKRALMLCVCYYVSLLLYMIHICSLQPLRLSEDPLTQREKIIISSTPHIHTHTSTRNTQKEDTHMPRKEGSIRIR